MPISDELDGHSFRVDEKLQVYIVEAKPGKLLWEEDPEKIGALDTERMFANLFLPADAFASFWSAAEAAHGPNLSMEIVLKPDDRDTLTVTNVGLFEASGGRGHPVVAELREQLRSLSKTIVAGFFVLIAVWILVKLFR